MGTHPTLGEIKGKFNPATPNKIYIDIDLVTNYELTATTAPNSQDEILIRELITWSVLLHELVHYEDYQFDSIMQNNIELGLYFEELVNGGYFELYSNGCVILVKP